jgi:hypothetical protein
MLTLKEIFLDVYQTSIKDGNEIHHSDKGTNHSYIDIYEKILSPYRHKKINFLEIGVNKGYSMMTWQKYFTNAEFYGIDIQNIAHHKDGYKYIIEDINNTDNILKIIGDIKFDVIIDDGSHKLNDQIHALNTLYPLLNDGGLFVVEDIENIDMSKNNFQNYNPEIYDNRINQNRWDDVLVIIKK